MKLIFDDSAVSETIGYVIIFGIVMAGIAMVFLVGSQILADTQESASFQGLEQSFEVIHSDLMRTAFEASPVMTTRVKIDYGTLDLMPGDVSGREIVIKDSGSNNYDMPMGVLLFDANDNGKSISIENGALVENWGGNGSYGSIMTSQPRIFYSSQTQTLLVSVINLKGNASAYGGGIDSIRLKYLDSSLPTMSNVVSPVTICMRSNNTNAWNDYFTNNLKSSGIDTSSAGWTNATFDGVTRLVVVTYNVSVEL